MSLQAIYDFTTRNKYTRSIVGFLIVYVVLTGLYLLGTMTVNAVVDNYYKNAPAKDFVDFYSVKVDNAPIGRKPKITLCRELKNGAVKIDAARTFIKYQNGKSQEVAQRDFQATISKDSNNTDCTTIDLLGQPQVPGSYSVHTEYCFYVYNDDNRYKKCDFYDSNEYLMTDTAEDLQRQIDELKSRQSALSAAKDATTAAALPATPKQTQTLTPNQSSTTAAASGNQSGNSSAGNSGNSNENAPSGTGIPLLDFIFNGLGGN